MTRARTIFLALLASAAVVGAAVADDEKEAPAFGWDRFELSGVCRVKGGFLLADDELVGSLIFVESEDLAPKKGGIPARLVKLERRRGSVQPVTALTRLLPIEDVEDLASDGEKAVYVLGSHSAGKGGVRRPEREFVVRAEWKAKDRELHVPSVHDDGEGVCTGLLDALAAQGVDPKAVNAEGLALEGTRLWVGLRSPLAGKKALLFRAPLDAFFRQDREKPLQLERVEVDLGGSGVRGLHWDAAAKRLLVLGGAVDDVEHPEGVLLALDPEGGAVEKVRSFDKKVVRKAAPEGIVRVAKDQLAIVLDGERSSGPEVFRFPWSGPSR